VRARADGRRLTRPLEVAVVLLVTRSFVQLLRMRYASDAERPALAMCALDALLRAEVAGALECADVPLHVGLDGRGGVCVMGAAADGGAPWTFDINTDARRVTRREKGGGWTTRMEEDFAPVTLDAAGRDAEPVPLFVFELEGAA